MIVEFHRIFLRVSCPVLHTAPLCITLVSTGSGQTLQQTPKISESAEIMKNQATESIVAYSLLPYLVLPPTDLHLIFEILSLKN